MNSKLTLLFAAFSACVILAGCQKPADDGSFSGAPSASPSGGSSDGGERTESGTDCGVVINGKVHNPVSPEDGQKVRVTEVISNNLLGIEFISEDGTRSGPQLLKLQGVASGKPQTKNAARDMLRSLSSGVVSFYKATNDCNVTLDGGGQGTIGQLISRDGQSFTEALVKAGLVDVDKNDACAGNQIGACLEALKGSEVEPMGEMRDFLWKPQSDHHPGMVIHEVHCNTIVLVNGKEFKYAGAGNGRCGTFRDSRPGCSFGSNIKVQVLDKNTGRPYTYKGQSYVTIPNGCNRFEFK